MFTIDAVLIEIKFYSVWHQLAVPLDIYTLTKGVLMNCAEVDTFIVNFSLLHSL